MLARERRHDPRLDASLDQHHLGAFTEPSEEGERLALSLNEARRPHVGGLHGRRAIEDDRDALGALAHDRHRGACERHGQRQQREDLQQEQRVALQALEEGRRLAITERGVPQEQARDPHLAAPHLEEIEEEQRHR